MNLLLWRFQRKKEGKIEVNIYVGINTTGYVLDLTSN
jgi:hypothetical protein